MNTQDTTTSPATPWQTPDFEIIDTGLEITSYALSTR
ncbi:pyrroloquinoline quinone precursor peptide PqqA [Streptacidiphilus carbonis]|jgi:coenzyme PQQ precursor peptide PqqA|nr:pyrroloquinoline quinone precursor peptide PqqA [Streptacidiphilus carbonis]